MSSVQMRTVHPRPWDTAEYARVKRAALATREYKQLGRLLNVCRMLAGAVDGLTPRLVEGHPVREYMTDPDHSVKLLEALSTHLGIVVDLVGGDLML